MAGLLAANQTPQQPLSPAQPSVHVPGSAASDKRTRKQPLLQQIAPGVMVARGARRVSMPPAGESGMLQGLPAPGTEAVLTLPADSLALPLNPMCSSPILQACCKRPGGLNGDAASGLASAACAAKLLRTRAPYTPHAHPHRTDAPENCLCFDQRCVFTKVRRATTGRHCPPPLYHGSTLPASYCCLCPHIGEPLAPGLHIVVRAQRCQAKGCFSFHSGLHLPSWGHWIKALKMMTLPSGMMIDSLHPYLAIS